MENTNKEIKKCKNERNGDKIDSIESRSVRNHVLTDLKVDLDEYKQRKLSKGKGDLKFDRMVGTEE